MILPHDTRVEPDPAMTGGRCGRRGEARIGCLAWGDHFSKPPQSPTARPSAGHCCDVAFVFCCFCVLLLLCFIAFHFQCIYVPPPEFRLDLICLALLS